ncbi:MAG: hypothetical protein NZ524_09790 [Thiobacillaceae bacterium]|nr:hypothetical protein [Thiobacillaceae bacterium]MCX7673097.1 hypothetical protein [Thiobacillaceae bacterium]MDW8323603.1 hypothetical protein [Burkholderiales bacterium]
MDYRAYARQLAALPGGAAAAVRDVLAPALGADAAHDPCDGCWPLAEGGRLCLHAQGEGLELWHERDGEQVYIARFDAGLGEAATHGHTPALALALLAIAAGDVDDERRLKQRLPRLDAAARELMLLSLCRLCG